MTSFASHANAHAVSFKVKFALSVIGVLIAILNPVLSRASETQPLTFSTIDYPPLMGSRGGIMTDVVSAAFATQGMAVDYNIVPMARIARLILEGEDTPVVGSLDWFHINRGDQVVHSVKIYSASLHFFYLKKRFPKGLEYQSLEELLPYHIGYIHGGSLIPMFRRAGLKMQLVNDLTQNVKKSYAQRIDMFAAIELSGWELIHRDFADYAHEFAMVKQPIHRIEGDAIFPQARLGLKKQFERGLAEIQRNGRYVEIFRRYYGSQPIPEYVRAFERP